MNLNEEQILCLLSESSSLVYICSRCGKIIFPKASIIKDTINFDAKSYNVRGGLGNKVLKDNICEECHEEFKKGLAGFTARKIPLIK